MPLIDLLPIAGLLSAPAFFAVFALAALGAPALAFLCLATAELYSSALLEPYARRLLRMSLTCAVPAVLATLGAGILAVLRWPWLLDWLRAAPIGPALLFVAALAFLTLLVLARRNRPSSGRRQSTSPLGRSLMLTILAALILWLAAALAHGLLDQVRAVLNAPSDGGIGVAPLMMPDATTMPPLAWASLAALAAFAVATAGASSLEYLLLLRDREPFGREAQAQMMRMAARGAFRAGLCAVAFLPVLFNHLPPMPALPGAETTSQGLLALALGTSLLFCLAAIIVSRSQRPWNRSLTIHLGLLCIWAALTALASLAFLCFTAT